MIKIKKRCYFCKVRKTKNEVEIITIPVRVDIFLTIPKKKWACKHCIKKNEKYAVSSKGELQAECLMRSFPGLRGISNDIIKVGKELFDEKKK